MPQHKVKYCGFVNHSWYNNLKIRLLNSDKFEIVTLIISRSVQKIKKRKANGLKFYGLNKLVRTILTTSGHGWLKRLNPETEYSTQ